MSERDTWSAALEVVKGEPDDAELVAVTTVLMLLRVGRATPDADRVPPAAWLRGAQHLPPDDWTCRTDGDRWI